MRNQPEKKQQKRCQCGSINRLRVSCKYFPLVTSIRKAKTLVLGMGLSQSEANKAAEDATAEKDKQFLAEEASGEGENQQLRSLNMGLSD